MNITELREAIADVLAGLSINAYSYAPDAPNTPAAFVYPEPFTYHPTFGHTSTTNPEFDITFVVRFLVQTTNAQAGQNQLDDLISQDGSGSAIVALEGSETLSGLATSIEVTELRNYGALTMPDGTRYLSAEILVSVLG